MQMCTTAGTLALLFELLHIHIINIRNSIPYVHTYSNYGIVIIRVRDQHMMWKYVLTTRG